MRWLIVSCAALAVAAFAAPSEAAITTTTFSFSNVSGDTTLGGGQLKVDVIGDDSSPTTIQFKFYNEIGQQSSICDIYFDDGLYLDTISPADLTDSGAGVSFDNVASPGSPPNGPAVFAGWESTAGYAADSTSPVSANGISTASEWLKVQFNLLNGVTYANVIAGLSSDDPISPFRIALHVQAIDDNDGGSTDDGSDWFILDGGDPTDPGGGVPEPATLAIWGLGLGIAGLVKLRRSKLAA